MDTMFFASCFILQIWYNNSVRKIRGKNMRKLNDLQKQMIERQFIRLGYLVIMYVEKYGNEKEK